MGCVIQGWGVSCRGGVGHTGVGWGVSCRGGVDGSYRGGVGCLMQVWGGSHRGGVGHAGCVVPFLTLCM